MSSIHFDLYVWKHVHHTRVIESSMLFFSSVCFRVCFLLGDKQEAKFGGVMSAQKHSLQTWDLARFGIGFIYIYDLILITFLIFSCIGFL